MHLTWVYWSFLCSKPTRRSSNPHLLIVSCAGSFLLCMGLVHTAELRGTWRERWFVSRSSICRLELGFYVWVDLSLPFLPLTYVKTASFTTQCVVRPNLHGHGLGSYLVKCKPPCMDFEPSFGITLVEWSGGPWAYLIRSKYKLPLTSWSVKNRTLWTIFCW